MVTRIWAQKNSTQWVHLHHHLYCQYRRQKIPPLTYISYIIIFIIFIICHKSYIRSCSLGAIQGVSRMVLSPSLLATWSSELNWTRSNSELFGNIKFWTFLATWKSELFGNMKFWKIVFILIDNPISCSLTKKSLIPTVTLNTVQLIFEGATCIWIRYYQRNYVFSKLTSQ